MLAMMGGRAAAAPTPVSAPPPVAAAAVAATPIAEWKTKLVQKRKNANQKEIDELRAKKAAAEARWIGVPAWKRAIIEKKEAQLKGL
jgi:epidermal growth factor receptor kinase substrate 8